MPVNVKSVCVCGSSKQCSLSPVSQPPILPVLRNGSHTCKQSLSTPVRPANKAMGLIIENIINHEKASSHKTDEIMKAIKPLADSDCAHVP